MTDQQAIFQPPPKVLTWFRVYLVVLCLMYAFCVALGVSFVFFPIFSSKFTSDEDLPTTGWILLIAGILFFVASALPFFLKPKSWVWIYDLVVICSGMLSTCLLPACIPLLIFWIKPETKKYFGRNDT